MRIEKAERADLVSIPAEQVVGTMKEETSVRQVVMDMMNEHVETAERLTPLLRADDEVATEAERRT